MRCLLLFFILIIATSCNNDDESGVTYDISNSIAYITLDYTNDVDKYEVLVYDIDTKENRVLLSGLQDIAKEWVGHKLYFIKDNRLASVNAKNGVIKHYTGIPTDIFDFEISPDHKFFAYSNESRSYIKIVNIRTNIVVDVLENQGMFYFEPRWSPSSRYLFIHGYDDKQLIYDTESRTVSKEIILNIDNHNYTYWSQNEEKILYKNDGAFYFYDLNNSTTTRLTSDAQYDIHDPGLSKDGNFLGYLNWPTANKSHFHYVDLRTNQEFRFTDYFCIHHDWLPSSDKIIFDDFKSIYIYELGNDDSVEKIHEIENREKFSIVGIKALK